MNVQRALALFAKVWYNMSHINIDLSTFLERVKPRLLLERFNLDRYDQTPYAKWNRATYVLKPDARKMAYTGIDYDGDGTIEDFRIWLDKMEDVQRNLPSGTKGYVAGDYDGRIEFGIEYSEPYSEEELAEARAYLEANPHQPHPQALQWRKPIPFGKL